MTGRPRVSVAIPAYNASPWILAAVESALGQTIADIEVVVVDDASVDGTAEVVAEVHDPRLRLIRNTTNLGHSGNWNCAVSHCRAPFVKFLCADDTLTPDCLEQMLSLVERAPRVGMVFSRREIAVDPHDAFGHIWRAAHESSHLAFGPLTEVNDGRGLFERCRVVEFWENWIGEPSNVLMRRSAALRLGGFHPFIRQEADASLWLLTMFHHDVGFVDAPLATYRVVANSITDRTRHDGSRWLDHLWLLESLLADAAIREAVPELRTLVRVDRVRALRAFGGNLRHPSRLSDRIADARAYLRYKRGARLRSAPGPDSPRPTTVSAT